jgi:hypothetical protein
MRPAQIGGGMAYSSGSVGGKGMMELISGTNKVTPLKDELNLTHSELMERANESTAGKAK